MSCVAFARIDELGSGSFGLFLSLRGVGILSFGYTFLRFVCLLDKHARACWKDALETQWNDESGLPVFLFYCTTCWGCFSGHNKTAVFSFLEWNWLHSAYRSQPFYVSTGMGHWSFICKAYMYGCGFRGGSAQLRHDLVCGSGYLGFHGPQRPGVANLLGSDTCADCCEHVFWDTVVS